ncbi:MAG: hypothetical protein QHJ82_10145 [Verrucomicrobiota bacterium]|nr:hypothetical protein [Verrucomicrobiota bacterium]
MPSSLILQAVVTINPKSRAAPVLLVDQIRIGRQMPSANLPAKWADPGMDSSAWEREIDQHVYRLYGLTADERLIAGLRRWLRHGSCLARRSPATWSIRR